MIALSKISETASKITLGWTPVPGAIGYRFQSSAQAPKWSHTWDATKSQVTFAKADWYKVEALGVEDAGEYPPQIVEPPDDAYFVADYTTAGRFESPWSLLFSYADDGTHSLPAVATPDGRVSVVNNPSGTGKVARFEGRDADPGWPPAVHTQKSEVRTGASQTWDKAQIAYGDERWFSTLIYLPYTATEKFEWAHGGTGTDPYTVLLENHTASSTGWSSFRMGFEAWERRGQSDANLFMCFKIFGGAVHSTTNFESIPLFRLCNADGTRFLANHNRWIQLVWGMRFSDTSSGWIECWVDDVNVFPRKARPTMWTGDFGMYLKKGIYKQKTSTFPETGRSVYYYGRTTIGYTKPT